MKSFFFSLIIVLLAFASTDALASEKYKPSLCLLQNGGTGAKCSDPSPIGPCQFVQRCYAAPVIQYK